MTGASSGLGLQTDKRPGDVRGARADRRGGGFDVVTTFNDLWYQPALPALLEIARGNGARAGRTVVPQPVHGASGRARRPDAALDLASRTVGRSSGSPRARGSASSASSSAGRSRRSPRPGRSCARLLAGDRSGFEGEVFRLEPGAALAYAPERERVPLLVGTWSPRLTAFAAELPTS